MNTTNPSIIPGLGYIFNFQGHGAFDPNRKVDGQYSQQQIEDHNRGLSQLEVQAMKETGRAVLYLWHTKPEGAQFSYPSHVGTWASASQERFSITYRKSRNNWGAQRTDVWFNFDGSVWHGVNLGDNDIVRVRRTQSKIGRFTRSNRS